MPIAFNPTTGEAVLWDGKAWVPTKTATNSETGESVAWDGFSWEKINVPKPPSGLLPALSSGTDILQKGLYSALEGGAKSLGFEDLARFAGEGAARNEEEANLALPNPQSFGEAQSIGDYFTAAKEALGTSLPSMGPAAAGALAGAGIGSIVPGLGTTVGALIGGTLGGIPGFYGSNREAQKDANQGVVKSEGAAILAAVPQAAMDTVLALVFPGLGKAVGGGLLTRVVKKGAEGIIEEVPTEVGQQIIERYQAGLPIADEEAISQYKEVAKAAGVLGGGIGGVGGAFQRRIEEPAPAPQTPADLAEHIANVRANMPGGGAAGSPVGGPAGGPPSLPSPNAPAGLLSQPPGPAGLLPPPSNFPGPFPGEAPPALGSPNPTPPIMPPSSGGAALTYQPQVDASQFLPQSQPDLIEQLAQPEPPKQMPEAGANAPQIDINQQAAQFAAQQQAEAARRIAENAQQQAPSFDLPPQPQAAPEVAQQPVEEPQVPTGLNDWMRNNKGQVSDLLMEGDFDTRQARVNGVQNFGGRSSHGMAKATSPGQAFKDLVGLLSKGIDPNRGRNGTEGRGSLDTAPLADATGGGAGMGTGSGGAYAEGPFILVGRDDPNIGSFTNKDQIAGVLVNDAIADTGVIEALREMFPDLSFESYSNTAKLLANTKAAPKTESASNTAQQPAAAPASDANKAREVYRNLAQNPKASPEAVKFFQNYYNKIAQNPILSSNIVQNDPVAGGYKIGDRVSIKNHPDEEHYVIETYDEDGNQTVITASPQAVGHEQWYPDEIEPYKAPAEPEAAQQPAAQPQATPEGAPNAEMAGATREKEWVKNRDISNVENIALPNKKKGWKGGPEAEVSVGQAPSGRWSFRSSHTGPMGGHSHPFSNFTFGTREEAIRHGFAELSWNVRERPGTGTSEAQSASNARVQKWIEEQQATEKPPAAERPAAQSQATATHQSIYDEFAETGTAKIVLDALKRLNLSSGEKIDIGKLLEQANNIRRQLDVSEETRKSLKRSLDDLSKSKNPPVTVKGSGEFKQFFVAGEKTAPEQKAAPQKAPASERNAEIENDIAKTLVSLGYTSGANKIGVNPAFMAEYGKIARHKLTANQVIQSLAKMAAEGHPAVQAHGSGVGYAAKSGIRDFVEGANAPEAKAEAAPDPESGQPYTAENVVNNRPPEPGTPPQDTLIFMACGSKKLEDGVVPAIEMYTGSYFNTLRSNLPKTGEKPQVMILSAEHGIISSQEKIAPYDRRLDSEKINDLIGTRRKIGDTAMAMLKTFEQMRGQKGGMYGVKNIMLVGGADYQRVMRTIIARLKSEGAIGDVGVMSTSGDMGDQLKQLKGYIQTVTGQKEEAAPKYKAPVKYKEVKVKIPTGGSINTQYEIVELDSLKQATGELQNRDRDDNVSYEAILQELYRIFDPTDLGADPNSDRGAPIVGDDDIIDSGNGRALLLGKVYNGKDDAAIERQDAYKGFLKEQGYDTEGFKKPVLIRRRLTELTPEKRRDFVVGSNKDKKAALKATEQAKETASYMKRNGSIGKYFGGNLNSEANAGFIQDFMKSVPVMDRGTYMTGDGEISAPGKKLIKSAIEALAYEDDALINTLLDEEGENDIKALGNVLEELAGRWAKFRQGIADKDIRPELEVTKQFVDAVKAVRDIRARKNWNLKDYLSQRDMFSEKDPVTVAFLKMFHAPNTDKETGNYKAASQKSMMDSVGRFISIASEQKVNPGFFDDKVELSPLEIIQQINDERLNKNDQGSMFASVLGDANASTLNASLPKKLTGAKPRYGFGKKNFPLAFDSDFSKALYIAYRKQNAYREWLIDQGVADGAIDIMGKLQRDNIKQIARDMPSGETLRVEDDFSIKPPEKAPKASPKGKKSANAPQQDFEEEIAPTAGKRQAEAAAAPQPVDPERLKQSRAVVKKFLQDMIARGDNNAAQSALKAIKDKGLSDTEVHHYLLAMDITSRILGPTKIKPAYLFTNLALNHPQAGRAAAMAIPPGRSQKYIEGLMIFSLEPGSRKRIQMNAFHEAFHILQGLMQAHDPKTTQIINKAFKSGMTPDDVDPSIKRALQSAMHSDGMSYWDFFKSKYDTFPALRSEFKKDYEASAYMFGLLAEAKQNGQNLNALMPAFKRFLNFIEQFKQRMGNALNGLGYRSVEDVFNDYAAGRQQKGYELKGNTITSGGPRASLLGPEPDEKELERRKDRAREISNAFWNKDAAQAAEWLANNTKPEYQPIARKVADRLKLTKRAGLKTTVTVLERGDKPRIGNAVATVEVMFGRRMDATNSSSPQANVIYRGLTDDTRSKPAPPLSDEIALHELIHAAIHGSIALARRSPKDLAPNLHEAVKDLNDLRNFVVSRYNDRFRQAKAGNLTLLPIEEKFDKWNTLNDEDEFVAWGMTSPEFQKYLDDLPTPSGLKTRFDDFVNAIRKLLGFAPGQETSLSKLIQISADMLGVSIDELRAVGNARNARVVSENQTYEERTDQPMASVLMDDESAHAPEISEGVATVMQGANTAARSAVSNWQKVKTVAKSAFDPLAKLPNTVDYLVMRYRLVGRIDELEDEARGFHDTMKKATKEQSEAIFEYLTTRGAAVPNLPAELRDVAVTVKRRIKEIGIELSDPRVGILSPQSVAMYEDKYLPRLYMKYLLEEKGLISTGPRMGLMEYARQRTDVDAETRVALGEVKDPGFASFAALYRPQRDIAVMKFLKGIAEASDKDWVYPNQLIEWKGTNVTAFWLADEANNIRERMLFEPDAAKKATMARVADDMQRLAADNVGEVPPQNYKRLPKSNRYGALKGLAVREEIYNDLISIGGFDPDPNLVDKIFGDKNSALAKGTQFWKMSKTILNPPTQIRQIISNAVMLNLSGVPLHRVASRMLQAMDAIKNDTEVWKKAKEYGIKGAGFGENELREATNLLREYLAENSTGIMNPKKLMNIVAKITGKAGDFYQYTDQVFKLAKIIDEVERKGIARMPNGPAKERAYAEAALQGHKWFFDYSLVHRGIKSLRTMPFGAPFITYYYKALPLIVEVATNPRTAMRFAPYIALMAAMPAMVASMYDVDDEDVDKLKMSLSEKLREKPNMLIFPFKDQNGNWQFLDWGYFFPWAMFVDTGRALAKGDVVGALGTVGALTSPALSLASAIKTNVDPFTGRQIINEYDPPKEKMMSFLSYVNSLVMPPIVTSYGAFGKAIEAATNSGVNRYGEPNMDAIQITARAIGFNFYPVVPELQRARNIKRMDYEIQMVQSNMTQSLKDKSLTPEKRASRREDFLAELKRRRDARNKYIRDSAIPAELSSRAKE